MRSTNRILIAPMDWGLGHASRCIPIIRQLLALRAVPILAGSGHSLTLLRMEFPELEYYTLSNLSIKYPEKRSFYLHFMLQFRKMKRQIDDEYRALQDLISKIEVDGIISDNRYGLYANGIPSVLITHQLNPKVGMLSPVLLPYVHRLINRFDHCWVPDYEGGNSLAGDLSSCEHSVLNNPIYIGPLSRMEPPRFNQSKTIDVLAILSGPEPHRSLLEKELLLNLSTIPGKHAMVRGTFEKYLEPIGEHVEVFDVLTSTELQDLIGKSRYLISRSGYSSIMDFVQLGRSALLIPTPGQTEQEYLGAFHEKSDFFFTQKQGKINLTSALEKFKTMPAFVTPKKNQDLNQILVDFLDSIY